MYYTINKTILLILLSNIIVLFSFIGCDSLLPDKLDEDKKYSPSENDVIACDKLTPAAIDSLNNQINFSFFKAELKGFNTLIDSAAQADFNKGLVTENQIIRSNFNTWITDSLDAIYLDSLMLIRYPVTQNVSYARLSVSQGRDIYIYTSLHYYSDTTNTTNINDYAAIQLIRSDTSSVKYTEDMQGETVSACTQTIIVSSRTRVVPTIRARYKLHIDAGEYIVRFMINRPEVVRPFKMLIISQ